MADEPRNDRHNKGSLASTPKAGVQGTQSLAGARGVLATLPSFRAGLRPARRSMSGSRRAILAMFFQNIMRTSFLYSLDIQTFSIL
jgi:hypothetical protein